MGTAKQVNVILWRVIRVGLIALAGYLGYRTTQVGGSLGLIINRGDVMDDLVAKAAPAVVSFLAGPLATWAAKKIAAAAGRSMGNPLVKVLLSAVAGMLAALGTGDVNGLADAIGTAVTGIVGGLGGSKARDIVEGKPYVGQLPPLKDIG